jgi:hypothetical protein
MTDFTPATTVAKTFMRNVRIKVKVRLHTKVDLKKDASNLQMEKQSKRLEDAKILHSPWALEVQWNPWASKLVKVSKTAWFRLVN